MWAWWQISIILINGKLRRELRVQCQPGIHGLGPFLKLTTKKKPYIDMVNYIERCKMGINRLNMRIKNSWRLSMCAQVHVCVQVKAKDISFLDVVPQVPSTGSFPDTELNKGTLGTCPFSSPQFWGYKHVSQYPAPKGEVA